MAAQEQALNTKLIEAGALVWCGSNQTGPQVQVVQRSPTNGAACHKRVLAGKVNTERHSQVAGVVNWNIYPKYGREVKMDDESRWWTPRNIQAKMYCCTVFFYNISKMRSFCLNYFAPCTTDRV